jgi:hypothetical protein
MKSRYKIEDLTLKDDSFEEHSRMREIFQKLRSIAMRGKFLSEFEKDFMGTALKLSIIDTESIDDYPILDNYKFKSLYLVYFRDITGGGVYFKHIGQNIYQLSPEELKKDLKYLYEKAQEWDIMVNGRSQPNEMMKAAAIEVRRELAILDNLPENKNDPYAKGRFRYRYKRWAVLLQNKYIYCKSLELFEQFDPSDFVLRLNGNEIEITESTIIHVLARHFSQITKQFSTSKSFHNEDFKPDYLTTNLQNIFNLIDEAAITLLPTRCIYFLFRNRKYALWISDKTKAVKGKGEVRYLRIETFYPLEDQFVLDKISAEGKFHSLNPEVSIYLKD